MFIMLQVPANQYCAQPISAQKDSQNQFPLSLSLDINCSTCTDCDECTFRAASPFTSPLLFAYHMYACLPQYLLYRTEAQDPSIPFFPYSSPYQYSQISSSARISWFPVLHFQPHFFLSTCYFIEKDRKGLALMPKASFGSWEDFVRLHSGIWAWGTPFFLLPTQNANAYRWPMKKGEELDLSPKPSGLPWTKTATEPLSFPGFKTCYKCFVWKKCFQKLKNEIVL